MDLAESDIAILPLMMVDRDESGGAIDQEDVAPLEMLPTDKSKSSERVVVQAAAAASVLAPMVTPHDVRSAVSVELVHNTLLKYVTQLLAVGDHAQ